MEQDLPEDQHQDIVISEPEDHLIQQQLIQQQLIQQHQQQQHSYHPSPQSHLQSRMHHHQIQPLPSKPLSAFTVFLKEIDRGGLSIKERAKLWSELSAQEKEVYHKKYLDLKESYDKYVAQHGLPQPHSHKKSLFPLTRVKAICKADKTVGKVSNETVQFMASAVKQFIKLLVAEASKNTDKKQLTQKELGQCILRRESLWFLRGVIGRKGKKDKEKGKEKPACSKPNAAVEKGQLTLI